MKKLHLLSTLMLAVTLLTFHTVAAQEEVEEVETEASGEHVFYLNFVGSGYGIPQGQAFEAPSGSSLEAAGGYVYSLDFLYSFPGASSLRLGYEYQMGLMGSAALGSEVERIRTSSHSLKMMWRPFSGFVSPYITASVGYGLASTPEVRITSPGGTVENVGLIEGQEGTATAIGVGAGIDIGGFLLYGNYMLPTDYNFGGDLKGEIGSIVLSAGYMLSW